MKRFTRVAERERREKQRKWCRSQELQRGKDVRNRDSCAQELQREKDVINRVNVAVHRSCREGKT